MTLHAPAQLQQKLVGLYSQLNLYLNQFPAHERHAMCMSIRATFLDMYDFLTESQKRYHKKTSLTNADVAHEQLRMKTLTAHQLGYFDRTKSGKCESTGQRRFMFLSSLIDEIGRMIGGWLKKEREGGDS